MNLLKVLEVFFQAIHFPLKNFDKYTQFMAVSILSQDHAEPDVDFKSVKHAIQFSQRRTFRTEMHVLNVHRNSLVPSEFPRLRCLDSLPCFVRHLPTSDNWIRIRFQQRLSSRESLLYFDLSHPFDEHEMTTWFEADAFTLVFSIPQIANSIFWNSYVTAMRIVTLE